MPARSVARTVVCMERQLAPDEPQVASVKPIATHEIRGGGGLRLQAREWGDPHGPGLLLIHGWSQSDLCWARQVSGELADRFRIVTFDLRGHGLSEKPSVPEQYADAQLWADDIAAVIEGTGLDRPVLVAWSYAGLAVTDYLRAYGDAGVGAINLVGGAVVLRPPNFDHIGPGFLANANDACESDLSMNIGAIRRFLRACTVEPLDEDAWITALCSNMVVPQAVRGALISRDVDGSDALAGASVPVLVTHGREDAIVLPSMAEHALNACEQAVPSWYDGVGHMPFWEATARFDRELAELGERAGGSWAGCGSPPAATAVTGTPRAAILRARSRRNQRRKRLDCVARNTSS
jgi:non-heme chloroperoxidase